MSKSEVVHVSVAFQIKTSFSVFTITPAWSGVHVVKWLQWVALCSFLDVMNQSLHLFACLGLQPSGPVKQTTTRTLNALIQIHHSPEF